MYMYNLNFMLHVALTSISVQPELYKLILT